MPPRRGTSRRTSRGLAAALRALFTSPRPVPNPNLKPNPNPNRKPSRVRVPPVRRTPRAVPRPGRWIRESHVTADGRRVFDIYLPTGRHRRPMPAVVLLHGCNQTAQEFVHASRFDAVADRNGVVLVVPHQEPRHHSRRCWRWYESGHQRRGAGEPGAIAGIVVDVVAERRRWRVDGSRVYVAGLSAGGAMALVLAAAYPDLFAAAGVHAAPPFRSATRADQALHVMAGRGIVPPPRPGEAMVPVVVVQGTADTVVSPGNADRIVEQWLAHQGEEPTRTRTTTGRTGDGRSYTVRRWYSARGRVALECWTVEGLGHAWSGGRPDASFADPAGPRAATLMWTFFRRHRLAGPAVIARPSSRARL